MYLRACVCHGTVAMFHFPDGRVVIRCHGRWSVHIYDKTTKNFWGLSRLACWRGRCTITQKSFNNSVTVSSSPLDTSILSDRRLEVLTETCRWLCISCHHNASCCGISEIFFSLGVKHQSNKFVTRRLVRN